MAQGNVVMTIVLEVEPEMADEVDDWYDNEHIPEVLANPGWLSARRFRDAADPRRILAIYELEDESTFAATDFSSMTTGRNAEVLGRVTFVEQAVWSPIGP